ncbi:MAG: hypothetical protein JWN38_812 [Candidatus Saccharibacteria bacterium]|nr:hypothetical protein [Candidatus Saccharibacteria bacterium]
MLELVEPVLLYPSTEVVATQSVATALEELPVITKNTDRIVTKAMPIRPAPTTPVETESAIVAVQSSVKATPSEYPVMALAEPPPTELVEPRMRPVVVEATELMPAEVEVAGHKVVALQELVVPVNAAAVELLSPVRHAEVEAAIESMAEVGEAVAERLEVFKAIAPAEAIQAVEQLKLQIVQAIQRLEVIQGGVPAEQYEASMIKQVVEEWCVQVLLALELEPTPQAVAAVLAQLLDEGTHEQKAFDFSAQLRAASDSIQRWAHSQHWAGGLAVQQLAT